MKETKGKLLYYEQPYNIPERTLSPSEWEMEDPELVVPDLEDSIESLVARQRAGLKMEFSHLKNRFYPTDPNQLQTAAKLIKDLQEKAEDRLKTQLAEIAEMERQAEITKKQKEQDKADYDAFVLSKKQGQKDLK